MPIVEPAIPLAKMEIELPDLTIDVDPIEKGDSIIHVISLKGKITNSNSNEFNRKFSNLIEPRPMVLILNMTELEYINSTGVAVVFSTYQKLREKGKLTIGGLHPFLRRVFGLMDMPSDLKVYDTLEEAKAEELKSR